MRVVLKVTSPGTATVLVYNPQPRQTPLQVPLTGENKQLADRRETGQKPGNLLGIRVGGHDKRRTTQPFKCWASLLLGRVNVLMGTQLAGKILLVRTVGDGNDPPAKFIGILDGKMAQTAEALDGDGLTRGDVHAAH